MHEFKIGGRVTYVATDRWAYQDRVGKCGTVTRAIPQRDEVRVLWDGDCHDRPHSTDYLQHVLELPVPAHPTLFPTIQSSKEEYPVWDGLMAYFPAALAEVAHVSYVGSRQHQPDLPTQWTRNKSTNHKDKILRHLLEGDVSELDTDGTLHAAKVAWRALANLQIILEKNGAPIAPAATNLETQYDPK